MAKRGYQRAEDEFCIIDQELGLNWLLYESIRAPHLSPGCMVGGDEAQLQSHKAWQCDSNSGSLVCSPIVARVLWLKSAYGPGQPKAAGLCRSRRHDPGRRGRQDKSPRKFRLMETDVPTA